jgi:hypothetical protein
MTWKDLITRSYAEIGVGRAGDVLAPDLLEQGRVTLDLLLDLWNLKPSAKYATSFQTFALLANHSPHTIGASGADWTVATARPSRILKANLLLPSSTVPVRQKIDIITEDEFEALRVPTLSSTFPTQVYYEPDFPLGNLFFYPIGDTVYNVELELETPLFAPIDASSDSEAAGDEVLGDDVVLPQGYAAAVMFTLSEWLAASNGVTVDRKTEELARNARGTVFDANDRRVRIRTRDAGMPRGRSRVRTSFNYHSRSF